VSRVALPIETKSRELDGKLWLTLHLLDSGHEVIVGHRPMLMRWADYLQPDVWVAVSAGGLPRKRDFLSQLEDEGVHVMVLDVEGGIFRTDDGYRVRLSTKILEHVDTYLAWGGRPGEILCENTPFEWEDVAVTGEPKFDLLHERNRSYYQDEAKQFAERFGEYILVTTNFGLVNHFDNEIHRERMLRDDILRLEKPKDRLRLVDTQQDIFDEFCEAIPHLAEAFDNQTIVVRPHPSEDGDTYRDVTMSLENARVEHSGSPHSWILGANAVIHNNSTIGVESVLLDQPTIAYCPAPDADYDLVLPNKISYTVESQEALGELVREMSTSRQGWGKDSLSPEQLELLTAYFRNVDGYGGQRVAEVIESVDTKGAWKYNVYELERERRVKRILRRFGRDPLLRLKDEINTLFVGEPHDDDYISQKYGGISTSELRNRVTTLKRANERFRLLEPTVRRARFLRECFIIEP